MVPPSIFVLPAKSIKSYLLLSFLKNRKKIAVWLRKNREKERILLGD